MRNSTPSIIVISTHVLSRSLNRPLFLDTPHDWPRFASRGQFIRKLNGFIQVVDQITILPSLQRIVVLPHLTIPLFVYIAHHCHYVATSTGMGMLVVNLTGNSRKEFSTRHHGRFNESVLTISNTRPFNVGATHDQHYFTDTWGMSPRSATKPTVNSIAR